MWVFFNGGFQEHQPGPSTAEHGQLGFQNRGLTFGEGLFEVVRILEGVPVFFFEHLDRMKSSARQLGFDVEALHEPSGDQALFFQALELARRNGLHDGELYLQLTRGEDVLRDHRYPPASWPGTFFMLAFALRKFSPLTWQTGAKLFVYPDLRHGLCAHKTTSLMANVMAKNHAYQKGGYEALMYRSDAQGKYVTEGGSSSYFLVKGGTVCTPEVDNILPGITRGKICDLLREQGIPLQERRVYLQEFLEADEVFLTSTVSRVMPVASIEEEAFAVPGDITRLLMEKYQGRIEHEIHRLHSMANAKGVEV